MEIDKDSVPSTIEAAVEAAIAGLEPSDIEALRSNGDVTPGSMHHFVGRFLRNSWSLWNPDTPLKRDAVFKYGLGHADDISSLLLNWIYAKVREEPFDPNEFVKRFHEHWEKHGTTSIEAGGYKGPMPGESNAE